jgi:hypothetical protein
MMKYFSENGRIRERGAPPDYHGYLFHINLGDKSIFREIFRSFSEYLGHMIANLSLLSDDYQQFKFSAKYPLDNAIIQI